MNGEDIKRWEDIKLQLGVIEVTLDTMKGDFKNHLKDHNRASNRLFILSMTLLAGCFGLTGVIIKVLSG